jgi:hypothetical protein
VKPLHAAAPLQFDLTAMLDKALDVYERVPVIAEDDEILDQLLEGRGEGSGP